MQSRQVTLLHHLLDISQSALPLIQDLHLPVLLIAVFQQELELARFIMAKVWLAARNHTCLLLLYLLNIIIVILDCK